MKLLTMLAGVVLVGALAAATAGVPATAHGAIGRTTDGGDRRAGS